MLPDAMKTASKKANQKTAEATGDLISNEIADKITNVSKKCPTEFHSMELHSKNDDVNNEIEAPKQKKTNNY